MNYFLTALFVSCSFVSLRGHALPSPAASFPLSLEEIEVAPQQGASADPECAEGFAPQDSSGTLSIQDDEADTVLQVSEDPAVFKFAGLIKGNDLPHISELIDRFLPWEQRGLLKLLDRESHTRYWTGKMLRDHRSLAAKKWQDGPDADTLENYRFNLAVWYASCKTLRMFERKKSYLESTRQRPGVPLRPEPALLNGNLLLGENLMYARDFLKSMFPEYAVTPHLCDFFLKAYAYTISQNNISEQHFPLSVYFLEKSAFRGKNLAERGLAHLCRYVTLQGYDVHHGFYGDQVRRFPCVEVHFQIMRMRNALRSSQRSPSVGPESLETYRSKAKAWDSLFSFDTNLDRYDYSLAAKAHEQAGQLDRAVELYELCLDRFFYYNSNPQTSPGRANMCSLLRSAAALHRKIGNLYRAANHYRYLLENAPEPHDFEAAAEIQFELGNPDQAVQIAEDYWVGSPHVDTVREDYAVPIGILTKANKFDRVAELSMEEIKLHWGNELLTYEDFFRALTDQLRARKLAEAVEIVEQYFPDEAGPLQRGQKKAIKATVHFRAGNFSQSTELWVKAWQLNPALVVQLYAVPFFVSLHSDLDDADLVSCRGQLLEGDMFSNSEKDTYNEIFSSASKDEILRQIDTYLLRGVHPDPMAPNLNKFLQGASFMLHLQTGNTERVEELRAMFELTSEYFLTRTL